MDDTCAVCAESLEWTAYGPCGHKDVCSTCVARLRFICDDRRCCICKTESDVVFVTKALGDYTAIISDFSVLPHQPKEGRTDSYWYHEHTQAFFDDVDHYRMIKAMCKLSCSVCDKMEDQPADASRRRHRFRNIDQLKGHLFRQHKLLMCSLCLEGRKVFICEQKLYTRLQLNQHISTGDSEVDGDERERGGFSGHPICEFCRTPFYGDNELYTHMSTEHYTCHICQRQHPGQYEYYKNYDDLEIHFRRDHFLCEDETCLSKKFIVFCTEAEFKRHNTLEHGGRMSRSKRNAALQIPTSFRYRRPSEQDNHRGRGRTFRRDTSDSDLSAAIQASLDSANLEDRFPGLTSSNGQTLAPGEISDVDPLSSASESIAATDSEPSSSYRQAVSQNSSNAALLESSFPPLPLVPTTSQNKSNQDGALETSMAARTRKQNTRDMKAPSSVSAWPVNNRLPAPAVISPQLPWPTLNAGSGSSSRPSKPAADNRSGSSSYSNHNAARAMSVLEPSSTDSYPHSYTPRDAWPSLSNSSGLSIASGPAKTATSNGSMSSSYSRSTSQPRLPQESSLKTNGLPRNRIHKGKAGHSASAPNLENNASFNASLVDFPPVSASQGKKLPTGNPVPPKLEEIHSANKSLVERMRIALDFDQDRYCAFKDLSAEYRQGLLDAETYLVYAEQFGLSHLVPELAQLCPDAQKQKALIETYTANLARDNIQANGRTGSSHSSGSQGRKDKHVNAGESNMKGNLADSVISTVRKLQSTYRPSEEEVEVLTKDGYRSSKGKEKLAVSDCRVEIGPLEESTKLKEQPDSSAGGGSVQDLGDSDGKSKQRKKTSKFLRVRLGDGSAAALLDLKNSDLDPYPDPGSDGQNPPADGLPVHGPWRNGGGQKLLASALGRQKK